MKPPKILLTTYHDAFLVRGGGEYELFSLAESLKRQGVVADIYGPYSRNIEYYDVVLHFSVHPGGCSLLEKIKSYGKPVVLWPNFWPTINNVSVHQVIQRQIDLASAIIFKSNAEKDAFISIIDTHSCLVETVPQIANSTYQISPPPNLFYDLYKFKDYAIWLGIIEPIKNQLATIEVLREKGIPLVLVGRYRDQNYYEACVAAGGESTLFISALPVGSEIVRAALKESLFYIEVPFEPPGLSAIEAGLSGCKMVLSDSSWSREIFGSDIEFCNPSDIGSISDAVDRVLESTPSLIGCDRLKKHSSGESIKKIINILKSVI